MKLSRRELLAGFLGSAGAAAVSRRYGHAAAPAERKPDTLIVFLLAGGMDQIMSTDPKLRSEVDDRVHLPYSEADISTIGGTRIGPLFRPFAPWVPNMAIVNSVVTGTVAHPTGIANVFQMRRTYPSFDRLGLLGHLARSLPERPLEHVHFNHGPAVNEVFARPGGRGLGVMSAEHSLLRTLHEVAQERELDRYTSILDRACTDCPRSVLSGLLRAMRGTRMAPVTEVPFGTDAKDLLPFAGSITPPSFDELAGTFSGLSQMWRSIISDTLFLVEHRLTRTILIDQRADWDSHDRNEMKQVFSMSLFVPPFKLLLRELEQRNLADRVGIVVTSELGRHPYLNRSAGKDHFPEHPVVMLGPGLKPGQYGETDKKMVSVPVSLETGRAGSGGRKLTLDDIGATILRWFGVKDCRRLGYTGTPLEFVLSNAT